MQPQKDVPGGTMSAEHSRAHSPGGLQRDENKLLAPLFAFAKQLSQGS